MFIYRVEDKDGYGCYQLSDSIWQLASHNGDTEKHPTPYYDKGIERRIVEKEICGFHSMEQLNAWFTAEEIKALAEWGFNIKQVEVEQITAVGVKQVLAIRKEKSNASKIREFEGSATAVN